MPAISITQKHNDRQRQASWYARELGWKVFPVHSIRDGQCTCGNDCSSPGKHPLTRRGVHDATSEPTIIAEWWRRWPWANIGKATGLVSGTFALDIDGTEGEESLFSFLSEHGRLPDTIESLTGGGGRHILFQHPGFTIRNAVRIAPGLDVRGDGGYIVAPTSLHLSGRHYEWELSSRPDEVAISPAPTWLLTMLRQNTVSPIGDKATATPASQWRELAQGATKGGRNDAITRVAGHLLRRYVNPSLALQLMLAWNESRCTPPLSSDEVVKTVNSVAAIELRRRKGAKQRGI